MTRLTQCHIAPGRVEFRVEGALDTTSLTQLHQALTRTPAGSTITLDLRGVRSLDHAAERALRSWMAAGVRTIGGSVYVQTLLERKSE